MIEYKFMSLATGEQDIIDHMKVSHMRNSDYVAVKTHKTTYVYPGKKYIFTTDGFRNFHSMIHELLTLDIGIQRHVLDQFMKVCTSSPIDIYAKKYDFKAVIEIAEKLRCKAKEPIFLCMLKPDLMYLGPKSNLQVGFSKIKHKKDSDRVSSTVIFHESNPESRALIVFADSQGINSIHRDFYLAYQHETRQRPYEYRLNGLWGNPYEDELGTAYFRPIPVPLERE